MRFFFLLFIFSTPLPSFAQENSSAITNNLSRCEKMDTFVIRDSLSHVYPITMDAKSEQDAREDIVKGGVKDDWGEPAKQIFRGRTLTPGNIIRVESAEGKTITGIQQNGKGNVKFCDEANWILHFKDAGGKLITGTEYASDVNELFSVGVKIPTHANTIWFGFADEPRSYWDNEGGARIPEIDSTQGCSFIFQMTMSECARNADLLP